MYTLSGGLDSSVASLTGITNVSSGLVTSTSLSIDPASPTAAAGVFAVKLLSYFEYDEAAFIEVPIEI